MSIQGEITRISNAVADIKDALESKGVSVSASTKIDDLAQIILDIPMTTVVSSDNGDGTQSLTITDDGSSISLPAKTITVNGTYRAVDDDAEGYGSVTVDVQPRLQNKTVTQNGSVTADTGYDGLGTVTVNVAGGKGAQTCDSMARVNATTLTATTVSLTVAKTGTYTVWWHAYRTSTSGTSGTRLYIGSTAYGTENTTFGVNSNGQTNKLTHVSLVAGQTITVYARSRGTQYYTFVMGLSIIEE